MTELFVCPLCGGGLTRQAGSLRCPAGHCKKLSRFIIDPEKCKGCSACARKCPVGAIEGVVRSPYKVDQAKCIKCGTCIEACKFGAISKK